MMLRNLHSRMVLSRRRIGVSRGMVARIALAVFTACLALGPVLAAEPLVLKGDVAVKGDALTLGDLVGGLTGPAADKPLFRAPALGQTGTIQARRIAEAALALGLGPVDSGGRAQVTVTRAARRIGPPEIEGALRAALEALPAFDGTGTVSIALEGAPGLVLPLDVAGPVTADEVAYDRRSRRVTAVVSASGASSSVRVAGTVVETVEVPVLTRALGRGETVQAADVAFERRPKNSAPSDVDTSGRQFGGRVARRPLPAGSMIRAGDLGRPEAIARGDALLLVYEVPGLSLSVAGRANEGGAVGDTISVVNPQSKRTIQATILGPGRAAAVTVGGSRTATATLADASAGRP